jgi:hypothetical protein
MTKSKKRQKDEQKARRQPKVEAVGKKKVKRQGR